MTEWQQPNATNGDPEIPVPPAGYCWKLVDNSEDNRAEVILMDTSYSGWQETSYRRAVGELSDRNLGYITTALLKQFNADQARKNTIDAYNRLFFAQKNMR